MPGRATHCLRSLVLVSMTAIRGSVWSAVKTSASSAERAIRCALAETAITAVTFFATRSMALTVPTWTFEV
ncbi:MAG: hypothetical protein DMF79_02725 [Acidobacteria bacterium]|nr:MAG: hypothetical protein DMF79_02725 [Acidobacteriota bacterium]